MRKANKTLRAMGYTAPVALILALATPAMGHEPTDENLWLAKAEETAWANRYGECWKSKTGPGNLDPCRVVAAVPQEVTVHLNFKFNKHNVPEDVINKEEIAKINDYIDQLRATPEEELVTVVGHTDTVGREESNLVLGQRRAEAVRNYIIGQGYQNVEAESRGESDLAVQTGDNVEEWMNRRVELRKTIL